MQTTYVASRSADKRVKPADFRLSRRKLLTVETVSHIGSTILQNLESTDSCQAQFTVPILNLFSNLKHKTNFSATFLIFHMCQGYRCPVLRRVCIIIFSFLVAFPPKFIFAVHLAWCHCVRLSVFIASITHPEKTHQNRGCKWWIAPHPWFWTFRPCVQQASSLSITEDVHAKWLEKECQAFQRHFVCIYGFPQDTTSISTWQRPSRSMPWISKFWQNVQWQKPEWPKWPCPTML